MTLSDEELQRYFARIGYAGGQSGPDLATLQALHLLHPLAIPFENLDSFGGRPVSLDPGVVFSKLVDQRRGGYCFEHNLLFMRVLQTLGFRVQGLSARVWWMREEDPAQPRTHKALLLRLDGVPWLVDVGFGGQTMTAPLRLDLQEVQATPHEPFRISQADGLYRVSAEVAGQWRTLYDCSLEPWLPVDYETSNWYVCTHPESRFTSNLICARVDAGGRHALLNRDYARYRPGVAPEKHEGLERAELERVLAEVLGINLAAVPGLGQTLDRLYREASWRC